MGLRRIMLAVSALALAGLAPTTAAASKPSNGCAPGFNLGAYSFADYVQLPRSQAAINDGLIDEAGIIAGIAFYDHNGNGVVCVQLNNGFQTWSDSRPVGDYLYNVVDDNSSADSSS
jgi:hypothetical protein